MVMNNPINRRFIERDTVKKQMENNVEYISPDDIESILNERQDWSDYTIKFIPRGTGWSTKIIDNDTDNEVSLDNLNPFAMDFYIKQLIDLTKKKYLEPKELSVAI
jgi:hypothetical protein